MSEITKSNTVLEGGWLLTNRADEGPHRKCMLRVK